MTRLIRALALSAGTMAIAAAAPAAAQSYTYPYGTYNPNPYTGTYYGTQPYGTYYGQYRSGQYAYPYGYSTNSYNPYNYNQGYGYNPNYNRNYNRTAYAEQACTSAVQAKLQNPTGLASAVSLLLGGPGTPQVNSITQAKLARNGQIRVKGLATSNSWFGRYGSGTYGALGYNSAQNPDLEFRCTVNASGRVTNVDIRKR